MFKKIMKSIGNGFKFFGKAMSTGNITLANDISDDTRDLFQPLGKMILDTPAKINHFLRVFFKRIEDKNKGEKYMMNKNRSKSGRGFFKELFSADNDNEKFRSPNKKIKTTEYDDIDFMKPKNRSIIDPLFAEELELTEDAEIDFGDELPDWVEKQHKKELEGRSFKEVKQELFEQDMSEISPENDRPQSKKYELKGHFVKAKADKQIRANIRLENKPNRS